MFISDKKYVVSTKELLCTEATEELNVLLVDLDVCSKLMLFLSPSTLIEKPLADLWIYDAHLSNALPGRGVEILDRIAPRLELRCSGKNVTVTTVSGKCNHCMNFSKFS